jgi:hypothetical protein
MRTLSYRILLAAITLLALHEGVSGRVKAVGDAMCTSGDRLGSGRPPLADATHSSSASSEGKERTVRQLFVLRIGRQVSNPLHDVFIAKRPQITHCR